MTTKTKILSILNSSEFVSGEKLARECNISRAAVWKSINSLRNDGFEIEAVTNKGYRISSLPDKLSEEKINESLKKCGAAAGKIFCYDTIDSTNSEAKRRCVLVGAFRDQNGELTEKGMELNRAVFAAEQQTAGRGRMGRVFESPSRAGIYFSLLYAPANGLENPALFTASAAVAVCEALDSLYGTECKIKWVNDIFCANKKICGILTEGISNFETGKIEAAIVGIGINIKNAGFDETLSKIAGNIEDSLSAEGKTVPAVSKNEIIAQVVSRLLAFYDSYEKKEKILLDKMISEYRKRSILTGKIVRVNPAAGMRGESYEAKVLDISEKAELVVEIPTGEKKFLSSGEVSLHGSY